jgi:hypothetical protein
MNTNVLLLLQTLLIFGQIVNAGLAQITNNKTWVLVIGAGVGALQFLIQQIGNQTKPKG